MLVEAEDDLPDVSDNLFAVCPHGGCEEELQAAQRPVFREIHDDLVTAVRVIEPLKRDLSAHPLVLEWHSLSLQKRRFVVVAFHIRKPPWDMVLVELEEAGDSEELPFCLAVQLGRQSIHSDIAFCHELARAASDWVLFRLSIGDLTVDYGIFQAAERKELSRSELRQAAAEMKQVMLAAKAAKLAQGLTANKKGKAETPTNEKAKASGRRPWLQMFRTWSGILPLKAGAPLLTLGQTPAVLQRLLLRPLDRLAGAQLQTLRQTPAVLQRLLLRPLDRLALSVSSSLGPFPGVHSKSRRLFRPLATVVGEPSADSIATEETVCLARKL